MIELFTFLKMGGAIERVDVITLLEGETEKELLETLANFEAQNARCFVEEDRQRLLAVVEAGFGDYNDFNKVVRHLLSSRRLAIDVEPPMAPPRHIIPAASSSAKVHPVMLYESGERTEREETVLSIDPCNS